MWWGSILQNNLNGGLNPRLHLQTLLQTDAHNVFLRKQTRKQTERAIYELNKTIPLGGKKRQSDEWVQFRNNPPD